MNDDWNNMLNEIVIFSMFHIYFFGFKIGCKEDKRVFTSLPWKIFTTFLITLLEPRKNYVMKKLNGKEIQFKVLNFSNQHANQSVHVRESQKSNISASSFNPLNMPCLFTKINFLLLLVFKYQRLSLHLNGSIKTSTKFQTEHFFSFCCKMIATTHLCFYFRRFNKTFVHWQTLSNIVIFRKIQYFDKTKLFRIIQRVFNMIGCFSKMVDVIFIFVKLLIDMHSLS